MAELLRIIPKDNVAVALNAIEKGAVLTVDGVTVTAASDIPAGHKIALCDIAKGENVIKYGFPIGYAKEDVAAGSHIHVDGVQFKGHRVESAKRSQAYQEAQAVLAAGKPHGDFVPRPDHVIPLDTLTEQARQPLQVHGHYRLAPIFSRCSRADSALPGLVFSSVMGMLRAFARAHRGA